MPPPRKSKKKIKIPTPVQNAIVDRLLKPDIRNVILEHGLNKSTENKIAKRLETSKDLTKLANTIIANHTLNHKIKLEKHRLKMIERGVKVSLMVIIPIVIGLFVSKLKKNVGIYVNKKVTNVGNQFSNIKGKGEKFIETSAIRNNFRKAMSEVGKFRLPDMVRQQPAKPPSRGWLSWMTGQPKMKLKPSSITRVNSNEFFNAKESFD